MEGPASPQSMLGLSREDLEAMNLQTLRARDPAIEQVLGSAGHVSLYDFDRATAAWVRGSTPMTPPFVSGGQFFPVLFEPLLPVDQLP